ncbi:MAG TPA: Holliday junction resolvase RuvX [Candidatus Eremiobacteraceae bacterium]|nr:Holliday junction resolvase RuvX [Candidatus Eremiobacteraceae bacterium]
MKGAVLGLDVGSVRIGVAVCEGDGLPAVPLCTITSASREKDVKAVVELAAVRNARTLVVGYPVKLDGSHGPAAANMDKFITALKKSFDGEVAAVDERLTTAAAHRKLLDTGLSGSRRRAMVDRMAAVEILEGWLAQHRRSGR